MSPKRQERHSSELLTFSEALRELERLKSIEDPEERIESLERIALRILNLARETKDSKLIDMVEGFVQLEKQSSTFFKIELLRRDIQGFKNSLEKTKDFVSEDARGKLLHCVFDFEQVLKQSEPLAWKSVQAFNKISDELTHELVGRRLEKEIVPDLAKQLGYTQSPNIFSEDGKEFEVDFVGEKNNTTSPFGDGRLRIKEILIAESKTTISKSDITEFSRKLILIKSKYDRIAEIMGCQLGVRAWILACYGWNKDLKDMAVNRGIEALGREEIEDLLESQNLLDRRIPICP